MTNLEINMKSLTAFYQAGGIDVAITARSAEKLIQAVAKITEAFPDSEEPTPTISFKDKIMEPMPQERKRNKPPGMRNSTPEEVIHIRKLIMENPAARLADLSRVCGRSCTFIRSIAEGTQYVDDVCKSRGPHVITREAYKNWLKELSKKRQEVYRPNLPGDNAVKRENAR